ncbi:MAG: hypothetical protein AAF467_03075 [Actinomycetota bacterium]
MGYVRSLTAGILALMMVVGVFIALAFAVASVLLVRDGSEAVETVAVDDTAAPTVTEPDVDLDEPEPTPAPDTTPTSEVVEPTAAAPAASLSTIESPGVGQVSCSGPDNGGGFAVGVRDADIDAEPVVVAFDLVKTDGTRDQRIVEVSVAGRSEASVAVTATPGSPYSTCEITAIQRGERVLITGS